MEYRGDWVWLCKGTVVTVVITAKLYCFERGSKGRKIICACSNKFAFDFMTNPSHLRTVFQCFHVDD